jgi:hypothetical protein
MPRIAFRTDRSESEACGGATLLEAALAARIEGATREAGTDYPASDDVRRDAEAAARRGRRIEAPIKQKTGKYRLHEVL